MSIDRLAVSAAALAVISACRPSSAPEPASAQRTYVLRLGSDTVAVDQFTMSRDSLVGMPFTTL